MGEGPAENNNETGTANPDHADLSGDFGYGDFDVSSGSKSEPSSGDYEASGDLGYGGWDVSSGMRGTPDSDGTYSASGSLGYGTTSTPSSSKSAVPDTFGGWIKAILGAASAVSSPSSAALWGLKQLANLAATYQGTKYDPAAYLDWESPYGQSTQNEADVAKQQQQREQQQQAAQQRQSDWLDYLDTFRKLAGGNVAPSSLLDTDNKDTDIYG